ncbi:cysteine protease StiP domain-containing protein [Deinococcus sp.]|uniref:cysteine protease StiP domain-containing protein n=1 Tax=Deinococcus sp. TaxID=47478 RepID=UPI0025C55A56|nr:cysteine protease StiP domain-containing protein [Deinococcus sp.]
MSADPQPGSLAHTLPPADVTIHLRPAQARLVSVAEKEALIRSGVSYGELLAPEKVPSEAQQGAYSNALARNGERVGALIAGLTAQLLRDYSRPVLVSLARAGTPVGCAMRRLARRWAGTCGTPELPHHTLSIIRGVGIDRVALAQVRAAHPGATLIFVDGWTGKGSILGTLAASLPPEVAPVLAVLSDPAGVATHAATTDDLLLAHAVLNATVCGLLSRTFMTGPHELHAACVEGKLRDWDVTAKYLAALDALTAPFGPDFVLPSSPRPVRPYQEVLRLAAELGVHDPSLVKPSVGEATRVFLRRQPAHLLLRDPTHPDTRHLAQLAEGAGIPTTEHPDLPYLAAALIAPGGQE